MISVAVPGDKSITQRALILASLATGESRLRGLLASEDAHSTAGALRALGAQIPPIPEDGSEIVARGAGLRGLRNPASTLDLGNSGTGARLLMGVLAGAGLEATITGDESLRSRPMRRVTEPLSALGASFEFLESEGCLPVRTRRVSDPRPLEWRSRVASAQVKSAVLLAGLVGGVGVRLTEPRQSRDHTERMLRASGAPVDERASGAPILEASGAGDGEAPNWAASGDGGGKASSWTVDLPCPPPELAPLDLTVPGDPSSAAFVLAAAALGVARQEVVLDGVGLNPGRTGFLRVLERMGADLSVEPTESDLSVEPTRSAYSVKPTGNGSGNPGTEPIGTVVVRCSSLRGVKISPAEVPSMIDELPLVAVLGAMAEGTTHVSGAEELRAKESDRIGALVVNLRSLGVKVEEHQDGLTLAGSGRTLRGRVQSFGDHRIAMAFAVLGAAPGNEIEIDTPGVASVSYPGFWQALRELGGSA